jgi:hypothetical protein
MIGKRTSIQSLTDTAVDPQRHGAHANPILSGYSTQTAARSNPTNHLTSLAFNGAFLAMLNSPQKLLPYPKCSVNAEPRVFG